MRVVTQVHHLIKCWKLVFQNPGMLKGVMQKVNPFKSTSQVTTALSACCSGDGNKGDAGSVLDNKASTELVFSCRSQKLHPLSHWNREGFQTLIRWVKEDYLPYPGSSSSSDIHGQFIRPPQVITPFILNTNSLFMFTFLKLETVECNSTASCQKKVSSTPPHTVNVNYLK